MAIARDEDYTKVDSFGDDFNVEDRPAQNTSTASGRSDTSRAAAPQCRNRQVPRIRWRRGSFLAPEQAGGPHQQHDGHDDKDHHGGGFRVEHLGQSLDQAEREAGDDRAQFTARLDAHSGVTQGAALTLAVDPERIHLFDPATGAALA